MKFFKKNFLFILLILFSFISNAQAAVNPYGKYQDLYGVKTVRCTWYAWEEAYKNAGVALPGWGNAQEWYNSAAMSGYSVGKAARANSIAVWSSSDAYGHVAYVVSVDEENKTMIVNEGGIPALENEGIIINAEKSIEASNLIGFIYLDEAPKYVGNTSVSSNNTATSKSNNNNLSNLEINIDYFEFNPEIKEYNLEVNYETKIIAIKAIAEDSAAIVTGTGEKALKLGENSYKILVTAEDGSKNEYIINIIRNAKAVVEEKETEEKIKTNNKTHNNILIISGLIIIVLIVIGTILLIKKTGGKSDKR